MKKKIIKALFILLPFLLAFPFHFVYQYIKFPLFAIYFPVNESVFEHTKLIFTPLIITYLIYILIYHRNINKTQFLSELLISILAGVTSMLTLYYTFKLIVRKEVMFLSILSLFLATIISQLISIYMHKRNIRFSKEISIFSLITITFLYIIFTTNPPNLEFFYDSYNNVLGLYK